MKISFIGFGNMAKAIACGLLKTKKFQISAAAPSLTAGVNDQGIETHNDNLAVLPGRDVIILAIKPAQMKAVYHQISRHLPPTSLLISLAAGIDFNWFAQEYDKPVPIVRAMPNIASAIGLGATPLMANSWVTKPQQKKAELIFNHVGITTWVTEEKELNIFTALSGSGPAYIVLFMEAMINAAVDMGIEKAAAQKFTLQTVMGAASLVEQSASEIAELRKRVTSPAGTTAAAIAVFQQHGLEPIVKAAMTSALKRAEELQSAS